ncbi:metallophosphoesterase [soil metagenome]
MKTYLHFFITILSVTIVLSCASYKKQYSKASKGWQQDTLVQQNEITHTMYLVGDAGDDSPDKTAPVLKYLKNQLSNETENSSVVFLGDNIYEYGMPPKEDSVERAVAEYRISSQLGTLDNFKGRPVFLPGNHDWRGWGLKGVNREEKFINNYVNNRRGITNKDDYVDYFLPANGCSGAEVVELNEQVVLIVIDTEWWLRDWDKEPEMNADCDIKNRAAFKFYFEIVLRKYRNKQVVVAMHHPMFTYGPHGGTFSAKSHLFPLTDLNPDLYIPLPVIGTLGVMYRGTIGSRQDVANQRYQELRAAILAAANKNGHFIFAAGHEHTLQFIERSGQNIIVSGSGSKTSPLRLGKGSAFASGNPGFSTVSFYKNGASLIRFWQVNEAGTSAEMVYQKTINKEDKPAAITDTTFAVYKQHPDTVIKTLTTEKVKSVGSFHKFLLGDHYRSLYIEQYPFPVLDLPSFKGGVTPGKLGGGNQTNSLRVKDSLGRDFVFRGLNKDVSRFLPFPFNRMTAAKYLVKDNFLSTHPFAPLAVAPLADAINVYHTNPQLYYVPAQPALGIYNPVFGDMISLVEERPAGKKWQEAAYFGNPDEIISTPDLMDKLLDNNKYQVDESWALRTRFLDLVVGDWDRHDDQWAWAAIKQPDSTELYRPIPRDRDQAFSKYDGLTSGFARFTLPFLRQVQVYGPNIYSYKWNTWSARLFDRSFLTNLSWQQWETEINYVQQHLTDSAIAKAFDTWPAKAKELSAPYLIKSIKARRNNLAKIARAHYEFINKSVEIVGTDEHERFVVERLDNDHTSVTVYDISKQGEVKRMISQRVFENAVTKTINIYGNGSSDEFLVKGQADKGIKIRLIGGMGKDLFTDSSDLRNGPRKTLIYDDLRTNTIIGGNETKDLRTNRYSFNLYDRRDYASEYNILLPLPIIGVNPDDGFLVGASFNLLRYGFKKEPYKSQQSFGGSFAFGTKAFKLNYTGDFLNTFGKLDFYLDTYYKGPSFAFNYAGQGNETKRPIDDANYYRVRQSELSVYTAIKKRFGLNGFAALGPFFQVSDIEATPDRYLIDTIGSSKDNIFKTKSFAGARLLFDFNSVDNYVAPHSGIKFKTSLNYIESLQSTNNFLAWRAKFSFYKALDRKENFILASQVGAGINVGDGYEFFQMPTIGADQGLRGYRTERFYGKSSFWQSTDIRIRFGSSYNETLPFTIGIFGGFDYGRVWEKEIEPRTWHYDYGGGVWFAPIDLLTFSIGAFIPAEADEETPRIAFKMGFSF